MSDLPFMHSTLPQSFLEEDIGSKMTPEQRKRLIRASRSLPMPPNDMIAFSTSSSPASPAQTLSSYSQLLATTSMPSTPTKLFVTHSSRPSLAKHRSSASLHPQTSTPPVETILPDFLNSPRCVRCTARIVHLSKPSASRPQRAVVQWGSVPYYTATGKSAEFVYHTSELASELRPELLRRWEGEQQRSGIGRDGDSAARLKDWASERLRDSWVIEQLVYWVEFLEEWKYYREYYIFREELFGGEVPEVTSPGCDNCGRF